MKRLLAILLILCIVLSLAGCGSSKKEAAKKEECKQAAGEIYSSLKNIYESVDQIGGDIYQAWTVSATEKNEIIADPLKCLAKNTHLDEKELKIGTIVALDIVFNGKTPSEKESRLEVFKNKDENEILGLDEAMTDEFLALVFSKVSPLTDFCVYVVQDSYHMNGTFSKVAEELEAVKETLKQLNADYPDFEGYENLKNIYTQTSAYYEFCMNPSGNLIQAMNTITEFRNAVKNSMSELDFVL